MATKIVKFVLLSHSALVNIRVRSTLRGSCPLRGTSSVKNVILNSNRLDDQGGVWQYNTLLSTLPPPPPSRARWGGNLSSLITNVVVVVVFSLLFSLPSQFSITWFFFFCWRTTSSISTRPALLALSQIIYQWLRKKSKALSAVNHHASSVNAG